MKAGDWSSARSSFEAALVLEESAEALYGLGTSLYWLAETEAAVGFIERAYAGFRRRPDPAQAAFLAIELSLYNAASLGNLAAARGWLGRASRLVSENDLTPMEGWVLLCRAGLANYSHDPQTAEELAREARERARESGDTDLELCTLAESGASLIELGRIAEGLVLLDEAMAGALGGEVEDLGTVVYASCRTIEYCARAAEIKRALQWIRAADDFNRRFGSAHIHVTCRMHYGGSCSGPAGGHFESVDAAELDQEDAFDLITAFDMVHDQARPADVLAGVARALRPGGTFLMVDMAASSKLEENIGRSLIPTLYAFSLLHCMTVSLAQNGAGLGTVWGEQKALEMLAEAGFDRVEVKRVEGDIVNNYYIARAS